MNNKHIGTSFDELLEAEGLKSEVEATAIKRVLAYQIEHMMKVQKISKKDMADRMHTSRSALERLLNPDNNSVTLHTLAKAAAAVGKKLDIHLQDF